MARGSSQRCFAPHRSQHIVRKGGKVCCLETPLPTHTKCFGICLKGHYHFIWAELLILCQTTFHHYAKKKITTPNTVIFWTMFMGPQAPAFANNYVQFPVFFTLRILATFTFFFARIKHHRNRIAIPFFSIRHGGMVVFGL